MNTERLHVIARAVLGDFKRTKSVETLQELTKALQNQVNQPNQSQHQENVATRLDELKRALSSAPSNDFSPAWQDALSELGGLSLLGNVLLQRVLDVFERNQITPSVALNELQEILKELQAFQEDMTRIREAFTRRGIGAEDLDPGTAEIGFLIPRTAVDNELETFGRELVALRKTLGPFAELATGSRPGFQIRTVSSTDLTVFLAAAPEVAGFLALAVERLVTLYKRLLEIKKLRSELKDQGIADEDLSGIDGHAKRHMENGITPLVDDLLGRSDVDLEAGRKNELTTELRRALNDIANRIDRGYNIEVRVKPLPPPKPDDDEDEQATDARVREWTAVIQDAAKTLEFIRGEGDPILKLPGVDSTDDSAATEEAGPESVE